MHHPLRSGDINDNRNIAQSSLSFKIKINHRHCFVMIPIKFFVCLHERLSYRLKLLWTFPFCFPIVMSEDVS